MICGNEFKKLTLSHIATHDMDQVGYDRRKAMLSDAAWELYWSTPALQERFTSPTATRAKEGRRTFRQYTQLPKIQKRHPELEQIK